MAEQYWPQTSQKGDVSINVTRKLFSNSFLCLLEETGAFWSVLVYYMIWTEATFTYFRGDSDWGLENLRAYKLILVRWPIITRSDPLLQASNSDSTFKHNDCCGFNEAWALTTCQWNTQKGIAKWGNVLSLCQTNIKAKSEGWRWM